MTAKQDEQTNEQTAELLEELKELREQRETIDARLNEVAQEISKANGGEGGGEGDGGGVDPEVVAHEDPAEALRGELDEWQEKYRRALADFQNFQRRSIENEAEARRQGVRNVVEKLLSVLDNFDLALQSAQGATNAEQILSGVTVIRDEMFIALKSLGLERIGAEVGEEFDPQRHEAMTRMPAEGVAPGHVSAALAPGYTLNDRVIRPAKVGIAPEAEAPAPADPMETEADPDE